MCEQKVPGIMVHLNVQSIFMEIFKVHGGQGAGGEHCRFKYCIRPGEITQIIKYCTVTL